MSSNIGLFHRLFLEHARCERDRLEASAEFDRRANVVKVQPSPQAFSARSNLEPTVSCDVTPSQTSRGQRGRRERLGSRLVKADLHGSIPAYDHRMRLLLLALLAGHQKSYATFISKH